MKVAVIHQCFQFETGWRSRLEERVLDEGSVFAIAHPDSLFDSRSAHLVGPNWNQAIQPKIAYREVPLRRNRSAQPTMGCKRVCDAADVDNFIDAAHQQGTSYRRA